jgi:hypothetical protein
MSSAQQELRVVVNRVYYPTATKNSGDFHILGTNAGKCLGSMHWTPEPLEKLRIVGEWTVHKGEKQFRWAAIEADIPVDPRVLLEYAGDLSKGIGPAMVEAIWEKFGAMWREDIEPGCLPRYSEAKHEEMLDVLKKLDLQVDRTKFISWFRSIGGGPSIADGAWEEWGIEARGVIQKDPYSLTCIEGCGFQKVENLRHHFKIEDRDPRRIQAAIKFFLDDAIQQGNTLLDYFWLMRSATQALGNGYEDVVYQAIVVMVEGNQLVVFHDPAEITQMDHAFQEYEIFNFFKGA